MTKKSIYYQISVRNLREQPIKILMPDGGYLIIREGWIDGTIDVLGNRPTMSVFPQSSNRVLIGYDDTNV